MEQCGSNYRSLTVEKAFDYAEHLNGREDTHTDALQIISGTHPDDGEVFVILPPFGDAVILPRNTHSIPA